MPIASTQSATVSAPRIDDIVPAAALPGGEVELLGANLGPSSFGPPTVLVDDEPDGLEVGADLLEALGHQVARYGDGITARQAVAREVPDLLITDYAMPGITGARAKRHCALAKSRCRPSSRL